MSQEPTVELDHFDLKILAVVQEDNLTPHREISEKVGLSAPAIARRLQRLRATGCIMKDMAIVDERKVRRPLTIVVEIAAESERLDLLDDMKRRFAASPNVQHCYYVTGSNDFVLIINSKDMDEYTQLTRELFFEAGNVKSFRTSVVMEKVKAHGGVPMR